MSQPASPDLWVDAAAPLRAVGRFGLFSAQVGLRALRSPHHGHLVVEELYKTTTRCLLPVVAVCAPFGMVMSLQGLEIFAIFGAQRLLSSLVCVAVLRELAPVMASVLVAAQGGSSCAAELGSMRTREELDATEVMGVDSLQYHVVPRVLALTLACPLLYVAGATAGLAGGFFTAVIIKGETAGVFMGELWTLTGPADVWGGVAKTLVFGLIIGLVSSYHGFNVTGGAAGVGRAVNNTVVRSVVTFIIVNYFLTSAFFGGQTR